jgi:hypothetical protein
MRIELIIFLNSWASSIHTIETCLSKLLRPKANSTVISYMHAKGYLHAKG